jgi:dUTP pyrophosphatase
MLGRTAPRSGLALHNHVTVGGGVVDEDYRGNLCVILVNHSDRLLPIYRGGRVAQIICEKNFIPSTRGVGTGLH